MVGMPNKLKSLLASGPRPRYHAARGLVYLGELDIGGTSLYAPTGEHSVVPGKGFALLSLFLFPVLSPLLLSPLSPPLPSLSSLCLLFSPPSSGYETDVFTMSDNDGHIYAR